MMKITPGLKGKTKYGTPVEILREIEPFKCNGKIELRRAEVVFFGRHTGQLVLDMNLNNIKFE
ncbi:MAG: hypothetical protein JRI26_10595 [Deltaproteobacteria bacterium]|nr:hypothetical protein [Deltaproteobacteria bacterium]